jgi:hypothetical protein
MFHSNVSEWTVTRIMFLRSSFGLCMPIGTRALCYSSSPLLNLFFSAAFRSSFALFQLRLFFAFCARCDSSRSTHHCEFCPSTSYCISFFDFVKQLVRYNRPIFDILVDHHLSSTDVRLDRRPLSDHICFSFGF